MGHEHDNEPITAHPHSHQQINKFNLTQSAIAIIALTVGSLALGGLIVYMALAPQLIDSKIEAGKSQAEATAREARTTAKVTEDKLGELRDALNAKGMNLPKLDGH